MKRCSLGLLLLAAPAWADDRPYLHNPSGPGVDRGALDLGVVTVLSTEGGAIPLASVHYARGLMPHVDLTVEVQTMGLVTLAKTGARLKVGELLSAAIGAEGGGALIVLPDFFGETELFVGGVLSPNLAFGVATSSFAVTVKGELMFVLSGDERWLLPRATTMFEARIDEVGVLSLGGGAMLEPEEERVLPLLAAGWTF